MVTTHTRALLKDSFGGNAAGLGRILLVRHGKGRGPLIKFRYFRPEYFDPVLTEFDRHDPEIRKRIRVWATGSPDPPYLYDVKAVVFLLQDPLRELYPECYAEAVEIEETARRLKVRVINPPGALSHTIKSLQSKLWRDAKLPTPRVYPFRSMMDLRDASESVHYPAVLMADRAFQHSAVRIIRSREELLKMDPESIPFPGALSEFIDTRKDYQKSQPDSELARFYHKRRVLVFGERVHASHILFSADPLVTSHRSDAGHPARLNPLRQITGLWNREFYGRFDDTFSPEDHTGNAVFVNAVRALGLDWAAVDYSRLANGRVMLWDAKVRFPLRSSSLHCLLSASSERTRHKMTRESVRECLQEILAA